jgi:LemA protein
VNASLLLWLLLAALFFWSVGLYNRLMRLRARGVEVLHVVEKHMRACVAVVHVSLPQGEGDNAGSSEWTALRAAILAFDAAWKLPRPNPLSAASLQPLAAAWDTVQAEWLTAVGVPADLAGPSVPPELRLEWDAGVLKVQRARDGLNQILQRYNEAVHQFPASAVAGAMGFLPAGQL